MRILIVNHEFPPLGGGGGNANYYIARELVRQGHEVTVLSSHMAGLEPREDVSGVEVIRLRCGRRHVNHTDLREGLFWIARALPAAISWARAHRPDIVQAFFALPNGPVAWAAARAAGCPLVIRLGGGDVPGNDPTRYPRVHRLLLPLTRRVMRAAHTVVVNSAGLRELAEAAFPGLSFEVIPNGVDIEEFRPGERRAGDGPIRLLCVARLIERKGLQDLLPALGALRREGHDFRLRIVGDGPMRGRLQELAAAEGLADRVRIDGPVEHEKLPEIYREADVFVLPSLAEGMPNVVLEAASCGLAIVGTRVSGMPELVREGEIGWLVEVGDRAQLQHALSSLLRSALLTARMGRASRRLAAERPWSRIASMYAETYARALAHQREGEPIERVVLP
ncbi:MAG: glycosyltransferase family 4 protein [Armatimonadota bacterium]